MAKQPPKRSRQYERTRSGKIKNASGVVITPEEQKELKRLVNKANRRRVEFENDLNSRPRYVQGVPTGETLGEHKNKVMGKFATDFEETFEIKKKSTNLNQFATRRGFNAYLDNLRNLDDKKYITKKGEMYKDNYIQSMKRGLHLHGNSKLIQKIKKMDTQEFLNIASQDEGMTIRYSYSPKDKDQKIATIEKILTNYEGSKKKNGK